MSISRRRDDQVNDRLQVIQRAETTRPDYGRLDLRVGVDRLALIVAAAKT